MPRYIDLSGQQFGRLTVLSYSHTDPRNRVFWHCQCVCGTATVVRGDCIKSGNTKSCGCQLIESATKHGHNPSKPSPTYVSWQAMWSRCTNPNNDGFQNYGARGIAVCDRWTDFRTFLADMGERPKGTSIDRIDGSRGYSPDNCRWATSQRQGYNKRSSRQWTIGNETLSTAEWAARYGIPRTIVQDRLRLGWTIERAVSTRYSPRR